MAELAHAFFYISLGVLLTQLVRWVYWTLRVRSSANKYRDPSSRTPDL